MTDQFVDANKMVPITPPSELVQQWLEESQEDGEFCIADYIATQAARWGADQELEACCEWLRTNIGTSFSSSVERDLRSARRPKPPSLKEQALAALTEEQAEMSMVNYTAIRTAIESLPS